MRLNAFTLLELLVTMAVSAVLLGMTYLALRIVEQQQQTSMRTLTGLRQAHTLQWLLDRDFRRAQLVYVVGEELRIRLPRQEIAYYLQDSSILRQQQELVDTFALPVLRRQYWFKGRASPGPGGLVDEVALTLRYRHDSLQLHASIWYDADRLLLTTSNPAATR